LGTELALVVSGASGTALARHFAMAALTSDAVGVLHLVMTGPACKVAAHELGEEWSTAARFRDSLPVDGASRTRVQAWSDSELMSPVSSGSHRLGGVVVLPCSAGMVGSLANGISRGLAQRVADVALKQRWPLVLGVRETPMSPVLLTNLGRLAQAGAHIVPPIPAFYLRPDEAEAMRVFMDHYVMRVLDLLDIPISGDGLRWNG
jgi:4-hydroxy-3-polyprenylbenzoate decarboxylase